MLATAASPAPPVSEARINAANELAWLHWRVHAREGGAVAGWLLRRGLDPVAVEDAGWLPGRTADGWDDLVRLLKRHGVTTSVGLSAGLLRRSENGNLYDGFRDRIVLPVRGIIDGRIAGFTARRSGEDQSVPKYVNSPTSSAYRKSGLLLGAWEARQRAAHGGLRALVLVEGPFDAINVSSRGPWAGITPCGTALTPEQGEWLAALANGLDLPLVLAYDGDSAGRSAEDRAWDLLSPAVGARLRLATLPDGRDPGDLSAGDLADLVEPALRR